MLFSIFDSVHFPLTGARWAFYVSKENTLHIFFCDSLLQNICWESMWTNYVLCLIPQIGQWTGFFRPSLVSVKAYYAQCYKNPVNLLYYEYTVLRVEMKILKMYFVFQIHTDWDRYIVPYKFLEAHWNKHNYFCMF